jgi:hypothetical protein
MVREGNEWKMSNDIIGCVEIMGNKFSLLRNHFEI